MQRWNKFLNLRVLVITDLVIFILKVCYTLTFKPVAKGFEDWSIAQNLARHGSYSEFLQIGPTAYKLPVYPFFLSFFVKIFPENSAQAGMLVQHFIYFLIPFLLVVTGRLLARPLAGIIAGFLFVLSPAYLHYSQVLEVTNVFIPVFLIWLILFLYLLKLKKTPGNWLLIAFGVCSAILALTQVVAVPLCSILVLSLLFFKKINFKGFLLVTCTAIILYTPWIIRNYSEFHRFVPSKSPKWQNIYLGFTPSPNILKDVAVISSAHENYTYALRKTTDEFQMERIYEEKVRSATAGKPWLYVKKGVQNLFLLWYVPSRYIDDNSPPIFFGRKAFVIIVNVLTVFALAYYRKRERLIFWGVILAFCGFTAPYMIGHASNMRFKLDFEWLQYLLIGLFIRDKFLTRKFAEPPQGKPVSESPDSAAGSKS